MIVTVTYLFYVGNTPQGVLAVTLPLRLDPEKSMSQILLLYTVHFFKSIEFYLISMA